MEPRNQMSSCFLVTVGDDTELILAKLRSCGFISKGKGGIGLDLSRMRHSEIGDVGYSKGIIPLMYVLNACSTLYGSRRVEGKVQATNL